MRKMLLYLRANRYLDKTKNNGLDRYDRDFFSSRLNRDRDRYLKITVLSRSLYHEEVWCSQYTQT